MLRGDPKGDVLKALVVWPGATWSTADVARGWAKGLEANGVTVARFHLDERIWWLTEHLSDDEIDHPEMGARLRQMAAESLAGALYDFQPDLVVVIDGKDIPPGAWKSMRDHGERLVLIHTESPYEDGRIEAMWWCADHHLVNDPKGVERLKAHLPNVWYQPHAYDPDVHHPNGSSPTEHDVVFVGSGFAGRAQFLAAVPWENVGRLTLAGHWRFAPDGHPPELDPWIADLPEPLPNEAAADLYRHSRLGLNLYRTDYTNNGHADGWAVGPREVEMAACGLPFLRQPRPEGDQLFPMLPTFGSPEELTDLASWWLAHDEERKDAAAAARAAVADRTFDSSAASLLRRVG